MGGPRAGCYTCVAHLFLDTCYLICFVCVMFLFDNCVVTGMLIDCSLIVLFSLSILALSICGGISC